MRRLSIAIFACLAVMACGQTLEQTAGIYYAYPGPQSQQTPAPEGFEPFYISHYGRHGSRWVTEDKRYTDVLDYFDSAANLTPLGLDVKARLEAITEDALGRSGSLSPVGERQHREIAARMHDSFPQVFADTARVEAVSSTSMRCAMSMSAFLESLKEKNPALRVTREPYERHMRYIHYTSPQAKAFSADTAAWQEEYKAFVHEMADPSRLTASLFANPSALSPADQLKLYIGLYWIASDMQDVDLDLSLYDIFTYDELRNGWRCVNARMYICNGPSPLAGGVMAHCADSLLSNIVACADRAVGGQGPAANLRFGHDTSLLRLLTLIGFDNIGKPETDMRKMHEAWQDYRLSPMAANLQMALYRNGKGEVIGKFLLNENEAALPIASPIAPYYRWEDIREYLLGRLER